MLLVLKAINVDIQVITTLMSQSTTSLFRRLTWQSSVTLEIRFAEDGPGGGGVPEVYYVSRARKCIPTFFHYNVYSPMSSQERPTLPVLSTVLALRSLSSLENGR